MKKLLSMALCLLLLIGCVIPAMAAGGVPKVVMEGTGSVVRITSKYQDGSSSGSGFVIQNVPGDVLIVTNDHVVEDDPESISVWIGENTLVYASIVCTTSERDLCILRVTDAVPLPALTISEAEPEHGAAIYAAGYPSAGDVLSDSEAHTGDSVTITNGIISAIRTFTIEKGGRAVKLLQINAAINPGNSGGPLFNEAGEVIGINTYKVTGDSQGVFGSVAVQELWDFLAENNIELRKEEPEETAEATEPTAEVEEPESDGSSLIWLGAAVLGAVILGLLLLLLARKKKSGKAVPLSQYMQACPQGIGVGNAVRILLPVALRLRDMHNEGKLHLQVNPDMVVVSGKKILLKDPVAGESGRYASGYAAPEIYKSLGFGVVSDIYSFGAVLYYVATGVLPANSLQPEKLQQDLATMENREFAALLGRCLNMEPGVRPQHMQELIYSLAAFSASDPEAETAPEPGEEKAPAPKKSRKIWLILIPVTLVLAAAVWLLVSGPAKSPDGPIVQRRITDGTPAADARRVDYTAEGAVEVTFAGSQLLDNDHIRYTLVCRAPVGSSISVSDPSENPRFAFEVGRVESEEDLTVTFDLPAQAAGEAKYITVSFLEQDGQTHMVYLNRVPEIVEETVTEPADPYSQAEALLAAGDKFGAAKLFYSIENDPDARERCFAIWDEIAVRHTIAAGGFHTLAVRTDGTVAVAGQSLDFWNQRMPEGQRQTEVEDWTKIIAVAANEMLSVGLRSDGTVLATGDNENGQCNVGTWRDIVSVWTNGYEVMGLKADGTVLTTSEKNRAAVSQLADIIAISGTMALKADGTVVSTEENNPYSSWTNIVAISNGLGLRADGTVAVLPSHYGYQEISQWRDIVAIFDGCTGIREDGTAVTVGSNYEGPVEIGHWKDLVAVFIEIRHVVGLRKDGTVIAAGNNFSGRVSGASKWDNIMVPGR